MKLSGKVKFMIYVSSNDAATVQSFIGIFENLIAIISGLKRPLLLESTVVENIPSSKKW